MLPCHPSLFWSLSEISPCIAEIILFGSIARAPGTSLFLLSGWHHNFESGFRSTSTQIQGSCHYKSSVRLGFVALARRYYLHYKYQSKEDAEANCPFLIYCRILIACPHHGSPALKDLVYPLLLDFVEGELDLSLHAARRRSGWKPSAEMMLYLTHGTLVESETSL